MPPVARGAVASGHREVSEAAAVALREGGNAFDAALTAGFAACVAEPMFASLGGGGFLLARSADGEDSDDDVPDLVENFEDVSNN